MKINKNANICLPFSGFWVQEMNRMLNFKRITNNGHCAKPAEKQAISVSGNNLK